MKYNVLCILAIIAAWIFALSDYLLNMREMFGPGFYSVFEGMSLTTVTYATFSLFAFPFLAIGLAMIFKNAGMSVFIPLMKGFLGTVPIFIHTSFIFYYLVVNTLGVDGQELLDQFDRYKNVMGAMYFAGLVLLCGALFIFIITGKSSYPKYFAWLNPLFFIILLNLLVKFLPSVGGQIYPLLVPATTLAVMMTVFLVYDLKRGNIEEMNR